MKVSDVYNEELDDYEILMSCMNLEYTKEEKEGESGYINLDYDSGPLCFEIDWRGSCRTFVKELKDYKQEFNFVGYDSDDMCYVEFKHIVIDKQNKKVILV